MDIGGTAVRARFTPTAEQTLLKQEVAREVASAPKYKAFRQLGDLAENIKTDEQLERTANIIGLPVVRRAINLVRDESPRLKDLPDTDAQVLDAVYKKLGKKAFRADGFETAEAKRELGAVMDDLSGGMYSPATKAFESVSKEIAATERTSGMVAAGPRPSKATRAWRRFLHLWLARQKRRSGLPFAARWANFDSSGWPISSRHLTIMAPRVGWRWPLA
jgi:hypothetical protein